MTAKTQRKRIKDVNIATVDIANINLRVGFHILKKTAKLISRGRNATRMHVGTDILKLANGIKDMVGAGDKIVTICTLLLLVVMNVKTEHTNIFHVLVAKTVLMTFHALYSMN